MAYIPAIDDDDDERDGVPPEAVGAAHAIEKIREDAEKKGKPKAAILPLEEADRRHAVRADGGSKRSERYGDDPPKCNNCGSKIRARFDTGGLCVSCINR